MLIQKLTVISIAVAATVTVLWLQRQSANQLRLENERTRNAVSEIEQELRMMSEAKAKPQSVGSKSLDRLDGKGSGSSDAMASKVSSSAKQTSKSAMSTVALNKSNLKNLSLRAFSDSFRVTDEAAAVLGLNNSERAAVDQAAERVINRHIQLDLAKMQQVSEHVTDEEGQKTSFKVPAYPEEGKTLAQEVLAALQHAIGTNRTELLLQYSDIMSMSADGFDPFGRFEKTITFVDKVNSDGSRGECKIFMKVVDSASGSSLVTGFANRDDAIPLNWRHLIQNAYSSR